MEISFNKYKISEELIKQAFRHSKDRYICGTKKIVFVGDMHVFYYDLDKFFPDKNLINRGIAEDTSLTLLQTIDFRAVELNPKKLFIIIGSNDIGFRFNSSMLENNLNFMLEYLKNIIPETKIYLCLIPPTNHDYGGGKINVLATSARSIYRIEKYNRLITRIASKFNIDVIDLFTPLLNDNHELNIDYSVDGVILNDTGYQLITKILEKYLD